MFRRRRRRTAGEAGTDSWRSGLTYCSCRAAWTQSAPCCPGPPRSASPGSPGGPGGRRWQQRRARGGRHWQRRAPVGRHWQWPAHPRAAAPSQAAFEHSQRFVVWRGCGGWGRRIASAEAVAAVTPPPSRRRRWLSVCRKRHQRQDRPPARTVIPAGPGSQRRGRRRWSRWRWVRRRRGSMREQATTASGRRRRQDDYRPPSGRQGRCGWGCRSRTGPALCSPRTG